MAPTTRPDDSAMNDAQNFLDKWYMAASASGGLWIQPRVPVLRVEDFCLMLRRIQQACRDRSFLFVVFHFEAVQVIHSSWQLILRAVEGVARTLQADCRVIRSRDPVGFDDVADDVRRLRSTSGACNGGALWMKCLDGTSIVIDPVAGPIRRVHGNMNQH